MAEIKFKLKSYNLLNNFFHYPCCLVSSGNAQIIYCLRAINAFFGATELHIFPSEAGLCKLRWATSSTATYIAVDIYTYYEYRVPVKLYIQRLHVSKRQAHVPQCVDRLKLNVLMRLMLHLRYFSFSVAWLNYTRSFSWSYQAEMSRRRFLSHWITHRHGETGLSHRFKWCRFALWLFLLFLAGAVVIVFAPVAKIWSLVPRDKRIPHCSSQLLNLNIHCALYKAFNRRQSACF